MLREEVATAKAASEGLRGQRPTPRGGTGVRALSEGTSDERTKLSGGKPTPTHPLRVALRGH